MSSQRSTFRQAHSGQARWRQERNRATLYDQVFELLLEGRHRPAGKPIDAQKAVYAVLRRLAFDMTRDNLDREPRAEIEARLLHEDYDARRGQAARGDALLGPPLGAGELAQSEERPGAAAPRRAPAPGRERVSQDGAQVRIESVADPALGVLDRPTDDQAPFVLAYPEEAGGEVIATGRRFPSTYRTPKERWLLDELRGRLQDDENVLVFARHTGTPALPRRILRLLETELRTKTAWLDAKKVPTHKRQAWIDRHVLRAGVRVLLVNPEAVKTGLNNLVSFTTAIWFEPTYSALTYRQANGRIHRIGQTRPVTVLVPYYAATAQEVAVDLVARKVTASLQVDGLDLQAALEAAGASEESGASIRTAMQLGESVYRALVEKSAA